jgi:hypothetical protein
VNNLNYKWNGLQMSDAPKAGSITYKITNAEPDASQGLIAKLNCRIPKDKGGAISFYIGATNASLKLVATLSDKDLGPVLDFHQTQYATADLGKVASTLHEFYLKIELSGSYASYASIYNLLIAKKWSKKSGHLLGNPFTVKDMRIFHLWVQDRAVYDKVARSYKKDYGEDEAFKKAESFANECRYNSAYQHLSGATSTHLPAGFAVRENGKLGPFPISLSLSNSDDVVLVDLTRADPEEFDITFKSESDLSGEVSINSLKNGSYYDIIMVEPNHYRISINSNQKQASNVVDGVLKFKFNVIKYNELPKSMPKSLSGVYIALKNGRVQLETQDPHFWLENPIEIALAEKYVSNRRSAESSGENQKSMPMSGDQVDLTLNSMGQVTDILATFGQDSGFIKHFEPPQCKGNTHNGIIELDNGHRYEFSNSWGNTDIKGMGKPGVSIPKLWFIRNNTQDELVAIFEKGKKVEINYCPYTVNGCLPRMKLIREIALSNDN